MPIPVNNAASPSGSSSTSLTSRARSWAEGFDFGDASAVENLEVARPEAERAGPATLQRAYALYRTWEDNDLGSARLLRTTAATQTLWALHTTTDGDDGFLELFSEKGTLLASGTTGFDAEGRRAIRWDPTPGAVRERVAPRDVSESLTAFHDAVVEAEQPSSPSGAKLTVQEVRDAARKLVGEELTTASVDGYENAALRRMLADSWSRLTSSSRAYADKLCGLYADAPTATVGDMSQAPVGTGSEWSRDAKIARGTASSGTVPPGIYTLSQLTRQAWSLFPTQVVPVTKAEAQHLLRESGATTSEARAAVLALADSKGTLYAGRTYSQGSDGVQKDAGLALFGASADGRALAALHVSARQTTPVGADPREVVRNLLGVDREVEVLARRQTPAGEQLDLRWRPPSGRVIEAKLTVPSGGGEPAIDGLQLPPMPEPDLAQGLAQRLQTALGEPREVLGWVGRDNSQGPGFVVAHRPTSDGPVTLSTVRIHVGGETATVTSKAMSTSASDKQLARDLAIELARTHAAQMVADPELPDAARLEVALRTCWAQAADLEAPPPDESAVGFDSAIERYQLMLGGVWGDNAVFVTFAKNGGVRIEDFN
ncbi:MAG: hypothetical protein HY901_30470 [Deltaproteobacteria bacterium]|nr:hypothetical protein [Deltaproteobacteria bacterium]